MTGERRYGEEEVKEIFEAAAQRGEVAPAALTRERGLSLAELQEIGREVGLEPSRVAEAAAALDGHRGDVLRRTFWGMPVSVGRVVELPRAPTEREWETLVGELRQTFGARGKVASHGELREWSNGNLHACVEPTQGGYRLRLGTLKGNAGTLNILGITGILVSLIGLASLATSGRLAESFVAPLVIGWLGVGALATNWIGLPRWAAERERQMEHIASRAPTLIAGGMDEAEPPARPG